MKKRIFAMILVISMMAALFTACGENSSETSSSKETTAVEKQHSIAVASYSLTDGEMVAFNHYLEQYITSVFENVSFIYSETISDEDSLQQFISDAKGQGAEGVMTFISYDLAAEVNFCAENNMYYMMASGTVDQTVFDSVADNEYFVGVVGPGSDAEYTAGTEMADNFAADSAGTRFVILSGGASMGNVMHLDRTKGMLDQLKTVYGGDYGEETDVLAAVDTITSVDAGTFTVTIIPGYLEIDEYGTAASEWLTGNDYDYVLGALTLYPVINDIKDNAKVGMVDSYTEENDILFNDGKLDYLTGKYGSIIGPSFAAMYNAVTGHAADFRENGKAFNVIQGFWNSNSVEDFNEKYSLSSSMASNAYTFEDLSQVCKEYNSNATLDDLEALAQAYSYDEVLTRRGE